MNSLESSSALRNEIPTYAGGLGVLAGDMVRSEADLKLPMAAVCLVSRAGYFRQKIDEQELLEVHQKDIRILDIEGLRILIGRYPGK